MNGADILAKFLRERGIGATVRGTSVSIKIDGIRHVLPVEKGIKVVLCNECSVSLYSPDSLELIYKAILSCSGTYCNACEARQVQEKETDQVLLLQRAIKCW
jgi:hypothetical protein